MSGRVVPTSVAIVSARRASGECAQCEFGRSLRGVLHGIDDGGALRHLPVVVVDAPTSEARDAL